MFQSSLHDIYALICSSLLYLLCDEHTLALSLCISRSKPFFSHFSHFTLAEALIGHIIHVVRVYHFPLWLVLHIFHSFRSFALAINFGLCHHVSVILW